MAGQKNFDSAAKGKKQLAVSFILPQVVFD